MINPKTTRAALLHSAHKVRWLEADCERMADVLALIVTLADAGPDHVMDAEFLLSEIARFSRAALVGATPPDPRLTT